MTCCMSSPRVPAAAVGSCFLLMQSSSGLRSDGSWVQRLLADTFVFLVMSSSSIHKGPAVSSADSARWPVM